MIDLGIMASASRFSPKKLSTLKFWLDASDESTITESSSWVQTVADKSGNNWNVSSSTYKPQTGTHTINGKNVLYFDGEAELLWPSSTYYLGHNYTFLMVCTPSERIDSYLFFQAGQLSAISNYSNKAFEFYAGVNRFTIGTGTETGPHLIGWVKSGMEVTGRLDGSSSGSTTLPSSPDYALTAIGSSVANNLTESDIAEVIICAEALSGARLAALENYLINKWGL